jgi:hypothetical protein
VNKIKLVSISILIFCFANSAFAIETSKNLNSTDVMAIKTAIKTVFSKAVKSNIIVDKIISDYALASIGAEEIVLAKKNGSWTILASGTSLFPEVDGVPKEINAEFFGTVNDSQAPPPVEQTGNSVASADKDLSAGSAVVIPLTGRRAKDRHEAMCKFASSQVYGLHLNAQNGIPNKESYKKTLSKLKKKNIAGVNNEWFAQSLVDESYGFFYKNGRLSKNDKKNEIEEEYFKSCMLADENK